MRYLSTAPAFRFLEDKHGKKMLPMHGIEDLMPCTGSIFLPNDNNLPEKKSSAYEKMHGRFKY